MGSKTYLKLGLEDYKMAYSVLEAFCLENVSVVQFGEFGDASFPGISDLDVFICLEDRNFAEDRKKILEFISKDETLEFLFFHDPMILPSGLLPYLNKFHTCYNLSLTVSNTQDQPEPATEEYLNFLNTIWTTFLLSLGPVFLESNSFEERDYLLVHKNLCQSIHNLDSSLNYLSLSSNVREEYVNESKSREWVLTVFKRELDTLYEVSGNLASGYNTGKRESINTISTARTRHFHRANSNSYQLKNTALHIGLVDGLYDFLSQFYHRKSDNELVSQYITDTAIVDKICKQLQVSFPFISPFAYSFHRNDFKFVLKKYAMATKNWIQKKKN